MKGVGEKKGKKVFGALIPLFFLGAYLLLVAEYTCVLRVGTGMVSLAGQGEAPDRLPRSRCLVDESFLCTVDIFSDRSGIFGLR